MSLLIENKFIEMSGYDDDNRLYRATDKGIHYLQIYNSMVELLDQKVEEMSLVDNEVII